MAAVQTPLLLHLHDDVLDHLFFVLIELQGRLDALVALHELCGRKAHRDVRRHGMVLDQVSNTVDAAMQRTAVRTVGRAKVQATRALAEPRHVQGVVHQLADALVARGANGNDWHAQQTLEQVDVNGTAVGRHLVHHVERDDHRTVKLHELQCQVQVALDVGGVNDVDDGVRTLRGEELRFSYRHSLLTDRPEAVVLRVVFQLTAGRPEEIRQKMEELMTRRKASQPLEYPSAGSTFKRPEGYFAAALIDQCGLKGMTVGGAQVSEKHAGFVINRGGATCADVTALMAVIQRRVWEEKGVRLEPEIKIIH